MAAPTIDRGIFLMGFAEEKIGGGFVKKPTGRTLEIHIFMVKLG